jgi:glycosyltransferase involved in cell wall biosynthesis
MRVLFFIQGFSVAASRYRVIQYVPHLKQAGIDADVLEYPKGLSGWFRCRAFARKADIIFFQRKRPPLAVLMSLRAMGKKVVYDFDDAIMFKNSLSANPYSLRRKLSFRRMLRFADLVIAGNEFLRSEATKYSRAVQILPTPIDIERYGQKRYGDGDTIQIGWIGDHGSIHYMESYKEVWEELGRRFGNVALTIICDVFIETKDIPLIRRQWSSEKEVEYLQDLDIGVMPLFDDLWSRGKCGFKIIQYMGVGLPVVCTPVGINRDAVESGTNGFWAETMSEWVEKLTVLIENAELREKMGVAGRKRMLERYTVQACAPQIIEWLNGLVAGGANR